MSCSPSVVFGYDVRAEMLDPDRRPGQATSLFTHLRSATVALSFLSRPLLVMHQVALGSDKG